ncbi:hypothetical protein D3C80_1741260 [compost metagenome]
MESTKQILLFALDTELVLTVTTAYVQTDMDTQEVDVMFQFAMISQLLIHMFVHLTELVFLQINVSASLVTQERIAN